MRGNDTRTPRQREPALTAAEAQHGARVRKFLAAAIGAAGGWLSFERFMDLALYAPGLGYYSAGARKLGAGGDFTTAPELSALFGACVARCCADVLAALPAGVILEIGAGSGRLAGDILERLEALGQLPAHYWIVEISADLRERQRAHLLARLPHLHERVVWLDAPPGRPFDGVILANEVLDALPVARFRWSAAETLELGVAMPAGAFAWEARPAGDAMTESCAKLAAAAGAWADGYVSEYCPRLPIWTAAVTRALRSGAVLWFDYGLPRSQYYHTERRDGTLSCHFRQRVHGDPFRRPGLEDITAWVDFTALAEAGVAAGFDVAGYTMQAYFLAAAGIDQEMRSMAGADRNRFARLANQARRLMMPSEMGERFKAMLWSRGLDRPPSGFGWDDRRHTL